MSNDDTMGLRLTRLGLGCAITEGRNIIDSNPYNRSGEDKEW